MEKATKTSVSFRINDELLRKVKEQAELEHVSYTEMIRTIIDRYFYRQEIEIKLEKALKRK